LDSKIVSIRQALVEWFGKTGRDLPWRRDYDPYHIWISEIMLQQTQMDRGVFYYKRWLERFPDIKVVAAAEEREILKYWEGLGYYARARNLHKAAQIMVDMHQGKVPESYETLLSLPGVGPYTAAAITSIAFNHDIAVVDANVERIFARLFDIDGPIKSSTTKKRIHHKALSLLPPGEARVFNQALMDLGGLICTPKNPACGDCPVAEFCLALGSGRVHERPVVSPSGKTILIEMATGVLTHQGCLFIQQRQANDVWGSLWEFPGGRLEAGETPEETVIREYREETGFAVAVVAEITTVVHHYMRYKVVLHGFSCRLTGEGTEPALHAAQDFRWVAPCDLAQYGFPAGHRKLIEFMEKSRHEGAL
jgi:A/G-specific adenine glycosylase